MAGGAAAPHFLRPFRWHSWPTDYGSPLVSLPLITLISLSFTFYAFLPCCPFAFHGLAYPDVLRSCSVLTLSVLALVPLFQLSTPLLLP